jgi:mono/diheme cytochrome c family protein
MLGNRTIRNSFSFKSQHLGTPDNDQAFGRLLVVVPGNPEKWVQYGVPEELRQSVRNVSVVAVEKRTDGSRHVYFKDRALIRDANGRLVAKGRFELGVGADACMDCHKGGVNPIFPTPGSVSDNELPFVDQVNQRFRNYLPASFDGNYDPAWFGPGLGTARPNAAPDALQRRVRQALTTHGEPASAAQVAGVAKHVNCAACHHARMLQPLNAPLNEKLIKSYVLGGRMPPKADLTTGERQALLDVVVGDYFSSDPADSGILMDWLLEGKCAP